MACPCKTRPSSKSLGVGGLGLDGGDQGIDGFLVDVAAGLDVFDHPTGQPRLGGPEGNGVEVPDQHVAVAERDCRGGHFARDHRTGLVVEILVMGRTASTSLTSGFGTGLLDTVGHQDAQILAEGLGRLFDAPQVTVVTPLLCQSKPSTQPKSWNHHGSESRRGISAGPNSSTMAMVTAPASLVIGLKSQGGALPVWSGSWASRRCMEAIYGCGGPRGKVVAQPAAQPAIGQSGRAARFPAARQKHHHWVTRPLNAAYARC